MNQPKKLPYGEDINYWQTGKSSPDMWIERCKKEIRTFGGKILAEGFGADGDGRAAFMLSFEIKGDTYKIVWPVLPSRKGNEKSARIQAATMLYHDVKAKCVSATVLGVRAAFFGYWMLPDGRTAAEATVTELSVGIPALFAGPVRPQLVDGDVVEGEYSR